MAKLDADDVFTYVRVEDVLRLYADEFLVHEPEAGWMLIPRRRMSERVAHFLQEAGALCQRAGNLAQTTRLYRRALELNPENAALQQQLVVCQRGLRNATVVMK
jgi:two-component SAPR family response regulator